MNFTFIAVNRATTQDTAYVKLLSLTDDPVTFTCSGGDVAVDDWQEIGTDRGVDEGTYPRVCYFSRAVITGLQPQRRYTWTATQGSVTHEGATITKAPVGYTGDVIQFFATCDHYEDGGDGIFEQYKEVAQANPRAVQGIFYQDDVGYFDSRNISDAPVSGIASTDRPDRDPTEYNYAASMAAYNFLTFDANPPGRARLWIMQNIPVHTMFGDHEFVNNYRWKPDSGDEFEDVNHDLIYYKKSRPVWDAFYGDCMPEPLVSGTFSQSQTTNTNGDADAESTGPHTYMAYGQAFGLVRMVQADGVSHACYDSTYATNNSLDVQLYDPTELAAIEAYLDVPLLYKQLWISNSFKDVNSAGSPVGSKDSWGDHTTTEWLAEQRAFADVIEASDNLNGTSGSLVLLRGNDHNAQVIRHNLDEGTDYSTPYVYEFNAGPVSHAGDHEAADVGHIFTGSQTKWTNGGEQSITRYQAGMVITTNSEHQKIELLNNFGDDPAVYLNYPNTNHWQRSYDMAVYAGVYPLPTDQDANYNVEQASRAHSVGVDTNNLSVEVPEGYKLTEIGYRHVGDGAGTISADQEAEFAVYAADASGYPTAVVAGTTVGNPELTQADGVGQNITIAMDVEVDAGTYTLCACGTTGETWRLVVADQTGPCSRMASLSGALESPWVQAADQSFSPAMYAKFELASRTLTSETCSGLVVGKS